ncbi:MAG: glycoside hydrolase family 127 protein [Candidatus Bathyarchaeia archaeon]
MKTGVITFYPHGFWGKWMDLITDTVIWHQWRALNDALPGVPKSHAMENLRIAAGTSKGEFYGHVFQDSDVYKWLEAASYCLKYSHNEDIANLIRDVINIIKKAQQPDGYINTFYTLVVPSKRWEDLHNNHELYCGGHLIEAAVAHYLATKDTDFLDVAKRFADHVAARFGPEPGKLQGYRGHPEIEVALVKLYRATHDKRYLDLAAFFILQRGKSITEDDPLLSQQYIPWLPMQYEFPASWWQAHRPVCEQEEVVGHAVMAMYLYCGMADIAYEKQFAPLSIACRKLWDDVTLRHMYITGGIGSSAHGEAFSFDYDLPNDRAYAETCANIGLVFWAYRMFRLDPDRKYIDVMERALYNSVLSGISLDGTRYFYTNPLEVWPRACQNRHDLRHVLFQRQPWFDCACCPPNIARLLASMPRYIYTQINDIVYVHLFAAGKATFTLPSGTVTVIQETDYPWDGEVKFSVCLKAPLSFTLAIRIPGWCREPKVRVNGEELDLSSVLEKGYAKVQRTWRNGDVLQLLLPMPIERVRAHPEVRACAGKVAIMRGPLVYCVEEVDNGPNLAQLVLPQDANLNLAGPVSALSGAMALESFALRAESSAFGSTLYSYDTYSLKPIKITLIPYYAWANRTPGEMRVWLHERL